MPLKILLIMCFILIAEFVSSTEGYDFEDFLVPVAALKAIENIDASSHPNAGIFDDQLQLLIGSPINFAEKYYLFSTGCGTMCQANFVINSETGDIIDFVTSSLGSCYRHDSRLLILNPKISENFDNEVPDWAYSYYMEITSEGLVLLTKTKQSYLGSCVHGQ
jgi:hypothetical protein